MSKTIFVSYSHSDVEAVSKIVESIEKKLDCDIWFDKKLRGGDEYFSVIAENILDCEYFLFVVSPNSVDSNWCIHELEFAMSEKRKIIAVWLKEFSPPPRVRLVISNTHYIRNYELDEENLAKTIAEALNADHYELSRGEEEYKLSEQKTDGGKYFVSPEEKDRMAKLLKTEQNQDFITCFTPENAVLLGLAYELGIGVERDNTKADFYYHIAAYKGSLDGEYLMLSLALENNSVDRAETVLRMNELAEAGCIKALVYWGDELYLGNWNLEVDKAQAYRWFKRAADAGDPAAKYFLGFGYRMGEIDDNPDYIIAWMYFHEAAQQNFPRAYRQIAAMYKNGQLVEKNLEIAREYYMKAVEGGDILSYNYLGNMAYNAQNYEEAFDFYQKAADFVEANNLKNAYPFYNIAWCYEFGQGVETSVEKAIEYYFKGVDKNNKSCINKVAETIYYDITEDSKKLELLKIAQEKKCNQAENFLGYYYEDKEDFDTAISYFEAGADKGCIYCMDKLNTYYAWIYNSSKYVNRNKALSNFRLYFSLLEHPDNKKYFEKAKTSSLLQRYYFAYAVELDIDQQNNKPDHSLAMYYYKKCLECNVNFEFCSKILALGKIYLEGNGTTLSNRDAIDHAKEITELCFYFFPDVYKSSNLNDKKELQQQLITMYEELAKKDRMSSLYTIRIKEVKAISNE